MSIEAGHIRQYDFPEPAEVIEARNAAVDDVGNTYVESLFQQSTDDIPRAYVQSLRRIAEIQAAPVYSLPTLQGMTQATLDVASEQRPPDRNLIRVFHQRKARYEEVAVRVDPIAAVSADFRKTVRAGENIFDALGEVRERLPALQSENREERLQGVRALKSLTMFGFEQSRNDNEKEILLMELQDLNGQIARLEFRDRPRDHSTLVKLNTTAL